MQNIIAPSLFWYILLSKEIILDIFLYSAFLFLNFINIISNIILISSINSLVPDIAVVSVSNIVVSYNNSFIIKAISLFKYIFVKTISLALVDRSTFFRL